MSIEWERNTISEANLLQAHVQFQDENFEHPTASLVLAEGTLKSDLRHLFQNLDGKSIGPKSLTGQIGEKLSGCGKRPVIGFKSIDCQIPTINRSILSKDQQYLLCIFMAIKSGNGKENLAVRDSGPLSHSRWLTTANITLRLYLSEESPTSELQEIVVFILKSYMSMWFSIETSKYFTEGLKLVPINTIFKVPA
ncbi:hypothetical protein AVEN_98517-1 [Araneus ventricosus]|uniref:Uncharacterized protein n=1 Tax=Araneus ventricosus TaxID=182803 RepID=A0A4Y2EQB7_ARAVE|nr:hypothetical protein AVEN_98517-1 [Araneus ventricosus]